MEIESRGAFTVSSFCDWAEISRSQVYVEAKIGRLRLTKCGRKTLITFEDAKAWLAALPKISVETGSYPTVTPSPASSSSSPRPSRPTSRPPPGSRASIPLKPPDRAA
jgi:hypothetical protein